MRRSTNNGVGLSDNIYEREDRCKGAAHTKDKKGANKEFTPEKDNKKPAPKIKKDFKKRDKLPVYVFICIA